MKKPVRMAVVGCGYWGPNLIRNFRSMPDCQLSDLCDLNTARLSHLKDLYPDIMMHVSFEEMLGSRDLDAIVIATPVHLHYKLAMMSLKAGKHVMIEKPMASSVAQCEELADVARKAGVTLMVGHTFLYSPHVRKIMEIIKGGDIGNIHYISSRRLNLGLFQKDINVVWDLAPHDISIIQYLMEEMPHAVNCQGNANVTKGVEDVGNMTLMFASGRYATVQTSWLDPRKVREMTIVGSKRMIVYNDLEPLHKITIYDQRVEMPPHYDSFAEFHYAYHYGDVYSPYVKLDEPLKIECRHFLDCILSGDSPMTSAELATDIVRILEAASESLRQDGARIAIEKRARMAP
ncbi:MAG: Gfo/Idh/MocA family oxidoreductase [bacterium]